MNPVKMSDIGQGLPSGPQDMPEPSNPLDEVNAKLDQLMSMMQTLLGQDSQEPSEMPR